MTTHAIVIFMRPNTGWGTVVSKFQTPSIYIRFRLIVSCSQIHLSWRTQFLKKIADERSWGRPSQTHFKFLVFRHCGKKLCFVLGEAWCWRSVSPAVCDCADQSHQFLRPQHTTITTNHNMQKNIPPRNNTPSAPTKRLPKTPCPHLPTRKNGLITRKTARRPGVIHQNVLKPHQVGA